MYQEPDDCTILVVLLRGHHREGEGGCIALASPRGVGEGPPSPASAPQLLLLLPFAELVKEVAELLGGGNGLRSRPGEGKR